MAYLRRPEVVKQTVAYFASGVGLLRRIVANEQGVDGRIRNMKLHRRHCALYLLRLNSNVLKCLVCRYPPKYPSNGLGEFLGSEIVSHELRGRVRRQLAYFKFGEGGRNICDP